jgi:hypothetical protein
VRRKVMQDFANTLCHMLVGWRMADDLEVFASLPDGRLSVDVLAGSATHSVQGELSLHIAAELQAWLADRLATFQIPAEALRAAVVLADIRTDRIATNRKRVVSFEFSVESTIAVEGREYRGRLVEAHHWHQRVPSNNSSKPTPLRGAA